MAIAIQVRPFAEPLSSGARVYVRDRQMDPIAHAEVVWMHASVLTEITDGLVPYGPASPQLVDHATCEGLKFQTDAFGCVFVPEEETEGVVVSVMGTLTGWARVPVSPLAINLILDAPAVSYVKVVDSDDVPVRGVPVMLCGRTIARGTFATTAADGVASFLAESSSRTYPGVAWVPGASPTIHESPIRLNTSREDATIIRIANPTEVNIQVVRPDRRKLCRTAVVHVTFRPHYEPDDVYRATSSAQQTYTTNGRGRLRIFGVAARTHLEITAEVGGYRMLTTVAEAPLEPYDRSTIAAAVGPRVHTDASAVTPPDGRDRPIVEEIVGDDE